VEEVDNEGKDESTSNVTSSQSSGERHSVTDDVRASYSQSSQSTVTAPPAPQPAAAAAAAAATAAAAGHNEHNAASDQRHGTPDTSAEHNQSPVKGISVIVAPYVSHSLHV